MSAKEYGDVNPPSHNEKAAESPSPDLIDDTARRGSVALNLIQNPLKVSLLHNLSREMLGKISQC